jgi:hypothetical protein
MLENGAAKQNNLRPIYSEREARGWTRSSLRTIPGV